MQSASSRDGVLYIAGAPRYNHTGRVVIYRLNESNQVVVSQILKGEQVSPLACTVRVGKCYKVQKIANFTNNS